MIFAILTYSVFWDIKVLLLCNIKKFCDIKNPFIATLINLCFVTVSIHLLWHKKVYFFARFKELTFCDIKNQFITTSKIPNFSDVKSSSFATLRSSFCYTKDQFVVTLKKLIFCDIKNHLFPTFKKLIFVTFKNYWLRHQKSSKFSDMKKPFFLQQ